jgi:hypothetical protein
MRTKTLQTLWNEWLKASDSLLLTLHEQTVAVTLRDVERVERIRPELETQLSAVRAIDAQAIDEAKRLAEEVGAPAPSLRVLISVLEKDEVAVIQATANKVLVGAQRIQDVMNKNRKLIESEMTYINGTLTLIARAANEGTGPYRGRPSGSRSILVDAAA